MVRSKLITTPIVVPSTTNLEPQVPSDWHYDDSWRLAMDSSLWIDSAKAIFGGAAGGVATVTFLSKYLGDRWLGHVLEKEKAEYAKQLAKLTAGFTQELEHYRAQLDRSVFVTRTHFETEYSAMKEVSQCLSEVKVNFLKLHPIEAVRN
jgi:hypothetical protein